MPTRPKPSGTRVHARPVQECPLQVVSQPCFTSRSRTELNPLSSPAPPPESGSYSTRFLAGCGACLSPCQYKPSTPTPTPASSKHPLPSDQTAPGRASGEGANWGVGGGTCQARSRIRTIFHPHFSDAIPSSRNTHGCKRIQTS